jgi:hypothetical protein
MMADLVLEGVKGLIDGSVESKEQRKEDGKQYFVMHPRIYIYAQKQLEKYLMQQNYNSGT